MKNQDGKTPLHQALESQQESLTAERLLDLAEASASKGLLR